MCRICPHSNVLPIGLSDCFQRLSEPSPFVNSGVIVNTLHFAVPTSFYYANATHATKKNHACGRVVQRTRSLSTHPHACARCSHSPLCLQTHTTPDTTHETCTNLLTSLSSTDTRQPVKHKRLTGASIASPTWQVFVYISLTDHNMSTTNDRRYGQRLRMGLWKPGDAVADSLQEMLDHFKLRGVKPVAYV
jgi:hypothetical protein